MSNEAKLKDYIHFYLGAQCLIGNSKKVKYVRMVNETGLSVCIGTNSNDIQIWHKTSSCKLILREFADLTDAECLEGAIILANAGHLSDESKIYQFRELLSKNGFWNRQTNIPGSKWALLIAFLTKKCSVDVFWLIGDGLAVKESELK